MKVIDHINQSKKTLFSIEILPPLKGQNISSIYSTMDKLMEFSPSFVDVTYHREEYILKSDGRGGFVPQVTKKRPGTVGICSAISNRYKVDTVPHIICSGFNPQDTEDALIDLNYVGIDNVLVLRGDDLKLGTKPYKRSHKFASELVEQVVNMNKGVYLDSDMKNQSATNFCIGVAGYPEKHFESPNLTSDLKNLKHKVDCGAEYIVTQMFFDNSKFYEFVKKCREIGITVPIIPGLKPLTSKSQLNSIPKNFFLTIPEELVETIENSKEDEEVRQIGVDWCVTQSKELMKSGVPVLHYYTMGNWRNTVEIAKKVF